MRLSNVLEVATAGDKIQRPGLRERNSYVLVNDTEQTLTLCRIGSPLKTPWTPTASELVATDWYMITP